MRTAFGIVGSLILLAAFLFFDYAYAVSVYRVVVLLTSTIFGAYALFAFHGIPSKIRWGIVGIGCGLIIGLRFVDWNSRKPFLRDLLSIRQGMTYAEVDAVMGKYIHEPESQTKDSVVYRHTNEGWGDSDCGFVSFSDGNVVAVEFSHD